MRPENLFNARQFILVDRLKIHRCTIHSLVGFHSYHVRGIGDLFVPYQGNCPEHSEFPRNASSWFGRGWVKSCIRDGGDILEKLAIVTDSTSDLNRKQRGSRRNDSPLYVTHKDRVYRDAVDITPSTFYDLLEDKGTAEDFSTASVISKECTADCSAFDKSYPSHITRAEQHCGLGSKSGRLGAPDRIHVVDSDSTTV